MNNCPACGADSIITFYEEDVPCSHCGGSNNVEYQACENCMAMWRSIDGEFLESSLIYDSDIQFVNVDAVEELEDKLREALPFGSMEEIVHKCLRCKTVSYEVSPGVYHCPECSFEWEVL